MKSSKKLRATRNQEILALTNQRRLCKIVGTLEMAEQIWDTETVKNITRVQSETNTIRKTLTLSSIECVMITMTYNRSLAIYDELSHQCHVLNTIHQSTDVDKADRLYVIPGNVTSFTERTTAKPPESYLNVRLCDDLDPTNTSGVYRITPVPGKSFDVFCDMDTGDGPWTVIQNRQSKEVDFYRNWDEFKSGFGDLHGNFWLGNDQLSVLTETPCVLRIQIHSLNGTFGYAEYSQFQVSNETDQYRLFVTGFSGNVSNAMEWNSGYMFSTRDRSNDIYERISCAEVRLSSWWHKRCTKANLNGLYESSNEKFMVYWEGFYGQDIKIQLRTTKMMLKKP
ncbi:microfibril-associated glycoprotein 4-like [Argopecten irradians]|uniref:microfibril-associated glycoprotein 4-like n=1 Tax=Argopecten irradians TaxID=31199 RepID=UPI003713FA99